VTFHFELFVDIIPR